MMIYSNSYENFLEPYRKILTKYKMMYSLGAYLDRDEPFVNPELKISFDEEESVAGGLIRTSVIYDKTHDSCICFRVVYRYTYFYYFLDRFDDYRSLSCHISGTREMYRQIMTKRPIPIHWSVKNRGNILCILDRLKRIAHDDYFLV